MQSKLVLLMVNSLRVFFSIDIQDDSLLSRIKQIQDRLDKGSAKMKLVEMENIHFTVRFLGDTPVSTVNDICSRFERISFTPFNVSIGGVRSFPNNRRPRVIWVGVTHNADMVKSLKEQIDELLHEFGYPPEGKFVPHITIARVRFIKNREQLMRNLESLADERIGDMAIDTVRLTKSTLTSSGPIYETVCEALARS